jgi:hypothetical protein
MWMKIMRRGELTLPRPQKPVGAGRRLSRGDSPLPGRQNGGLPCVAASM